MRINKPIGNGNAVALLADLVVGELLRHRVAAISWGKMWSSINSSNSEQLKLRGYVHIGQTCDLIWLDYYLFEPANKKTTCNAGMWPLARQETNTDVLTLPFMTGPKASKDQQNKTPQGASEKMPKIPNTTDKHFFSKPPYMRVRLIPQMTRPP